MGTDIVYIPRIRKMLTKKSFINYIYTKKEQELANKFKDSTNFYATRFAAKEAIIKATNGKYDFRQIEILKDIDGKPLPKILNENLNINLSLSFDNDYALSTELPEGLKSIVINLKNGKTATASVEYK